MINIRPITKEDLKLIVDERNKIPETLRTPFLLNYDQQIDYYNNVICNRYSRTRYLMFSEGDKMLGYGGIENIEWENSRGEISILVFEENRKKGYGVKIVEKILDQAFNFLNLHEVWGECYLCGAWEFWKNLLGGGFLSSNYDCFSTLLPDRKYYNGKYHYSLYFSVKRKIL